MESAIKGNVPWVAFLHCVSHVGLPVMNEIGKIEQAKQVVHKVIDCQNWFAGNEKMKAILDEICGKMHRQTREFLWSPLVTLQSARVNKTIHVSPRK